MRSVGNGERKDVFVRVKLTKEAIEGLVDGRRLILCLHIESLAEEGVSPTFAQAVSEGSRRSEGIFQFQVIRAPTRQWGRR